MVIASMLVGACLVTEEPAPADDWAGTARRWRAAFYEAGAEGEANLLHFLAEDVLVEDRIAGAEVSGWNDFLDHGRSVVGGVEDSHPTAMFVSAEGFLDQYSMVAPVEIDLMDRVEMRGATATAVVVGGSVAALRRHHVGQQHLPASVCRALAGTRDVDVVEALADRWVAVWNGEGDVAEVYAAGVHVEDTLRGVGVDGRGGVAAAMGDGGVLRLGPVAIASLPDRGGCTPEPGPMPGRAIFVSPSDVDPKLADEVRIVLEADDGTGCPGRVAVSLEVVADRVVAERRYHEPASVARCLDTSTLEPGWWEGIEVPEPVRRDETEPMTWRERDVTVRIHNGTPEVTALVRWGLERFDAAGLPLPAVGSVTFLVERSRCEGLGGFYSPRDPPPGEVTLCSTADQVCLDDGCQTWTIVGRHVLVHEYAHAWLEGHVDDATRDEFLRLRALDRWQDPSDDWADRGVEHAAEAIAVGLLEEPAFGGYFDRTTTCEDYLAGFRVLTGSQPPTTCP